MVEFCHAPSNVLDSSTKKMYSSNSVVKYKLIIIIYH